MLNEICAINAELLRRREESRLRWTRPSLPSISPRRAPSSPTWSNPILLVGAPPSNPEGAEHDDLQDRRSTSVADACIYIRQSTMAQVRFNQESTERQYNLASKAQSLGWSPEQIRILDRDLGQSGARTTNREDFKTLVSDVAMGQVGAIFSLEASRLARSNQDWHRLLELCAITSTLVIDEDGCYDPAEFNDGLVLGMKGTFAQAELHIIRARLHGGKLNKAHKGELRFPLPVGFVFDDDKIVLDPDQEVQGAVRTVFELFEQGEQRLRRGAALPGARPSLSASVVRRCLGWQTALGSTDPFAGARPPGESILRRHLRVRAIPILQADWADRRDPHSVPPRCHRMSGASSFLITIQAISPGINSSPTANAWRGTGPIAKSSRDRPERAFVCCRACWSAAFAGGAWVCAIPAMAASTRSISATGASGSPGTTGLHDVWPPSRSTTPLPSVWSPPSHR